MTVQLPGLRGWVLAACLAAGLGWLLVPQPDPAPPLVKARRDEWRLPALPRQAPQTSMAAAVFSAGYWGAAPVSAGAAKEPPPEDRRWRIAAVFSSGGDRGVLVSFEAGSRPPLRLRAGDALPSGDRIESISDRDVCVRIGKKLYRLGVERREP